MSVWVSLQPPPENSKTETEATTGAPAKPTVELCNATDWPKLALMVAVDEVSFCCCVQLAPDIVKAYAAPAPSIPLTLLIGEPASSVLPLSATLVPNESKGAPSSAK